MFVITYPRKSNRDGNVTDDFRPQIVLNTDLKILTRILTSRLQIVADRLTSSEQTCAVNERTIPDNLHLVRTILYLHWSI